MKLIILFFILAFTFRYILFCSFEKGGSGPENPLLYINVYTAIFLNRNRIDIVLPFVAEVAFGKLFFITRIKINNLRLLQIKI